MQPTRREFLKRTGQVSAAVALAGAATPRVHAAEDNTINIALVGCGGRGTGAALNALSTTSGPVKLVAMADVQENRLTNSLNSLSTRKPDQVDVPEDRRFVGFDAYEKAIACLKPNDVVLLTTPPCFRPMHVEHAVEAGVNIFMEKAFAVDAPGIRRILAAGKKASEKNLKVAGGLMSRHYPPLEEAIKRVHDGEIGDLVTLWAYRVHHAVGFTPRPSDESELLHQIRNYHCYTWINGSYILDWLIHNLDVCCWAKDAWPVSAQGQGGRQVRTEADQLFDHYAVEYRFADGSRMMAQGRHAPNCWGFFGDILHGTKGSAVLGEGIRDPKLYNSWNQTADNLVWENRGSRANAYDIEHEKLFKAIRADEPYNETERSANAAMVGILGRMAAESGAEVTWGQAMSSDLVLAPGIEAMDYDTTPPVMPDENGDYPIAKPGFSTAF